MSVKKQTSLAPLGATRDPFAILRAMTSEFDRFFEDSGRPSPRSWFRTPRPAEATGWFPDIDVFQKDGRLVTRIDLPGMRKEDVKVQITDGHLAISGERKSEAEEKKDQFYRCEREYGSFYRAVPLPEGVKFDEVKATFADGVLEVTVPLPAPAEQKVLKVEIEDRAKAAKTAA